jgi:hypothetical protein
VYVGYRCCCNVCVVVVVYVLYGLNCGRFLF